MKNSMKLWIALAIIATVIAITTAVYAGFPATIAKNVLNLNSEKLVTMDLELKDNLLIAKYGVTVFMDDFRIADLAQGERMIKSVSVPDGLHTITFFPDSKKASALSMDVYVNDDVQIESTIQTHRDHVKINNLEIKYDNGTTKAFRDLSDDAWMQQLTDTVTRIAIEELKNAY